MTDELKPHTLTALEVHPGRWQVAYDGRIFGDDRGYSSESECIAAIPARVAKDWSDAVRYNRPRLAFADLPGCRSEVIR